MFHRRQNTVASSNNRATTRMDLISTIFRRAEGQFDSPLAFQSSSPGLFFSSAVVRKWTLSPRRKIHSFDRCVESIDVHPSQSSRYLLSGSRDGILSVYDLADSGAEKSSFPLSSPFLTIQQEDGILHGNSTRQTRHYLEQKLARTHKPIARSHAAPIFPEYGSQMGGSAAMHRGGTRGVRLGPVLSARWYPVDTGAFVSAHTAGSIVIWDTNEMTPVLRVHPFAFEGGNRAALRRNNGGSGGGLLIGNELNEDTSSNNMPLSCIDLSYTMPHLIATGSWRSPLIKLVDIRTGSASHTLIGHDKVSGISSLQWSPTVPHILASACTQGVIRLWDIRKAGRNSWLMGCLDPEKPRGSGNSRYLSNAFYPDLSHLKNSDHTKKRSNNSPQTKMSSSSGNRRLMAIPGPNDYSQTTKAQLVRSHESVVNALAFDPSGQYLVSHGIGDLSLKVWDLRDSSGQLIPRRYLVSPRTKGMFDKTQLRVVQYNNRSDSVMIWITQDTKLAGFLLHDDDTNASAPGTSFRPPTPKYQLTGHLKSIRDFFVLPSEASLQGELLTAAADGLILVWQPKLVSKRKQSLEMKSAQTFHQSSVDGRKRARTTTAAI